MQLPRFEILYTEGDRLPEIAGVLKNVDLTGHTLTLFLARPTGLLTKTATILDPEQGSFKVAWSVGDLVSGLSQVAMLRLTTPGGLNETLARFELDVYEVPAP